MYKIDPSTSSLLGQPFSVSLRQQIEIATLNQYNGPFTVGQFDRLISITDQKYFYRI